MLSVCYSLHILWFLSATTRLQDDGEWQNFGNDVIQLSSMMSSFILKLPLTGNLFSWPRARVPTYTPRTYVHERTYLHERATVLTYSDVHRHAPTYVHRIQYKSMCGYGHTRTSMSTSKTSHRVKLKVIFALFVGLTASLLLSFSQRDLQSPSSFLQYGHWGAPYLVLIVFLICGTACIAHEKWLLKDTPSSQAFPLT